MFAVIFRAQIKNLDEDYKQMATRLRERAITDYNCIEFSCATEENAEITISYWNTLDDITRWKQDPEHLKAQQLGGERWYQNYSVDVVEVRRHYQSLE